MVIKVHFSHFFCVSGVAFLRLTEEHLGGISRNLESNLLKTLGENYEKSTFFPKMTHLLMELELVIGTIRKGIKSTI